MKELDPKLLEKIKKRIERELVLKEKETIEYWMTELEMVYKKNHQTLAEFKSDIRAFIDRMRNRIEVIKTKGV